MWWFLNDIQDHIPGLFTVPGKFGDNLAPGALSGIYKQAGWKWELTMKHAVVIENRQLEGLAIRCAALLKR